MKKILFSICLFAFSFIAFKQTAIAAEPTVINTSNLTDDQVLELQEDTILNIDTDKTLSEIAVYDYSLTIEGTETLEISPYNYSGIWTYDSGKVTVNSGTIISGSPFSINNLEINGGEVYCYGIIYPHKNSVFTINGGHLECKNAICAEKINIGNNMFVLHPWNEIPSESSSYGDGIYELSSSPCEIVHAEASEDGYHSTWTELTSLLKIVPISEVDLTTGISLNETSITLKRYEFFQLFANVTPDNATNKKIVWSSSNKDAVYVDNNGQVFAIKSGTAVITAKTEDGNYEASCEVTVPEGDEGSNLGLKIELINNGNTPSVNISYNGSPIYEQRDYVLRFGSDEETGLSKVAILGMDDYLWIYSDPTLDKDYPASEYSEERLNRTLGLKIELNSYDGEEAPILKIIYDGSTLNEGTDYFVEYSANTDDDSSCFVITGLDDYIWNDNH